VLRGREFAEFDLALEAVVLQTFPEGLAAGGVDFEEGGYGLLSSAFLLAHGHQLLLGFLGDGLEGLWGLDLLLPLLLAL